MRIKHSSGAICCEMSDTTVAIYIGSGHRQPSWNLFTHLPSKWSISSWFLWNVTAKTIPLFGMLTCQFPYSCLKESPTIELDLPCWNALQVNCTCPLIKYAFVCFNTLTTIRSNTKFYNEKRSLVENNGNSCWVNKENNYVYCLWADIVFLNWIQNSIYLQEYKNLLRVINGPSETVTMGKFTNKNDVLHQENA